MTESDAKTRQCCGGEGCGHKLDNGIIICVASDCMGWIIEYRMCRNGTPLKPGATYSPTDDSVTEMAAGGFCGLARES